MGKVTNIRPSVPSDLSSIVKPEELVDIVEMTPLTLQDRRIYNLLIANSWNEIFEKKTFEIARSELTRFTDSNNHDIAGSLRRLMSSIVVIKIRNNRNGRPSTRQIQLLGANDIEDYRGPVQYSFPPELLQIIRNTQVFARLHTKVMFELTSKYSLALYEFLQRRCNLDHVSSELMTLEEARGLLGVPRNKLGSFGHFNKYALQIATREVSFLTEYDLAAEPVKTGRTVTHIRFHWSKKTDLGSQISVVEELERSRVGRKSRMRGEIVPISAVTSKSHKTDISGFPAPSLAFPVDPTKSHKTDFSPGLRTRLAAAERDQGRKIAREAGTGWCIDAIADQFHAYIDKKGPPENFPAAWIGFVKNKVKTKA